MVPLLNLQQAPNSVQTAVVKQEVMSGREKVLDKL